MFWGLILKTNKKYSQTLKTSFHLSQASLDESASNDEPVQVMYMQDGNSYLLCTLQKNKTTQCALDLNFATGDKVCFSTKGNGIVHLTGFLVQDEMDFDDELGEDEEDEDEEVGDSDEEEVKNESNDLRNKLTKKDKKEVVKQFAAALGQVDDDDDDSEDGEESDEESDDEPANTTMEGAEEESDDDDDDEEDDDDEDEDESDSDEEEEEPKAKQMKFEKDSKKKPQQQNGLQNGHKEEQKKQKKDKENKQQQQQQQQQKSNEAGKTQKLQGGLIVQDLKVGKGNEAKPGKKVQVYYEGRLQSNNKMFDSTKQGPGFKFTLGRNEVIRGWDLGVNGMKVGGKRKLVIPAALAYGSKGSPPVIPPNSTLVFDVELKNVLN